MAQPILVYITVCCGLWLIIATAIYRVWFSPLAGVPGPKLAALTGWVEAYYELLSGSGGQFLFEYRRWHSKYGPIVRISPNEVHIQDWAFYEQLYSLKGAKLESLAHRFNNPMSSFATVPHDLHRVRRGALNPFFSRRKIAARSASIQASFDRVCQRLATEFCVASASDSQNRRVLRLDRMWGSWTSDTISDYCFGSPYNFIEHPEFDAEFTKAMLDLLEPVHWITQFPMIPRIMGALPDSWLVKLDPRMATVRWFNQEMVRKIQEAHALGSAGKKAAAATSDTKEKETIFTAMLGMDLPPSEITTTRLQHEAISVVGAGIETTMRALSVISYHILANPDILMHLRSELDEAIRDGQSMPSFETLSQLPYLTACIMEGLRLSYGTSQRMPRRLNQLIQYREYSLPAGVVVGMSNYDVSHDETLFPNSFDYRPERWLPLGTPKAPDGSPLSRYMTAFGKGTRSCVGMQLAYAELYIGIPSLFHRFELSLWHTDRSDVDLARDRFVPRPKEGSQGVRVMVTGVRKADWMMPPDGETKMISPKVPTTHGTQDSNPYKRKGSLGEDSA